MIVYLQMIETDEDKSKFEEIYQEYRNLGNERKCDLHMQVTRGIPRVTNGCSVT